MRDPAISSVPPTIVVTGASRRLGLFLCEQFAARQWRVLALSRFPQATVAGVEWLSVAAYTAAEMAPVLTELARRAPRIDALVHNASIFEADGEHFCAEAFQQCFDAHMAVPAALNMQLRAQLYDEQRPGNIVHITDIYAENPHPNFALYCATKAGAENLMKGFAKKFAPGVRVNAIAPGPIKFLPSHTQAQKDAVLAQTLLPFEAGFEPVYQALCAILENPYMTGNTIKVDGGRSLGRL